MNGGDSLSDMCTESCMALDCSQERGKVAERTKRLVIVIGASLSEPHIDEFAVYICIVCHAVNHFMLVFCMFLHHALNPKVYSIVARNSERQNGLLVQ